MTLPSVEGYESQLREMRDRYDALKREQSPVTAEDIGDTRDLSEEILQIHAGLNVTSPHGKDTPKRFVTMLEELTQCRDCSGDCMKWKTFKEDVDQMIVVNRIPFSSVCNHHVVPFVGFAWIGYVPDGMVAGLSKFARVTHHFARKLQVQENLTKEIATFLEEQLAPKGVMVVLEAEHLCMTIRGTQTPGTITRTVETRGVFSDHSRTAKNEFLMGIK
jgi:GTP cyclohydrolase I